MKRAAAINEGDWVKVTWTDSTSHGGVWSDRDEVRKLETQRVHSVGCCMKNAPSHITLAAHVGDGMDGEVGGDMAIPWFAVESWCPVRFGRKNG